MHAPGRRLKRRGKRRHHRLRTSKAVRRARKRPLRRRTALLRAEPVMPQPRPAEDAPGFDQGYNQGFDEGFNKGHDEGYQKGLYSGGDGIVDQLLPSGMILPEVSVQTIIAAGIESLSSQLIPVKGTVEVMNAMQQAMD